jgi:hypothetical protein
MTEAGCWRSMGLLADALNASVILWAISLSDMHNFNCGVWFQVGQTVTCHLGKGSLLLWC